MQRIRSFILVLLVVSLSLSVLETSVHVSAQTPYANSQIYVGAKWVADNKNNTGVVIVDMRSPTDYANGHIPGAINFQAGDLLRDVNNRLFPVNVVTQILGQYGINENQTVVWYGAGFDAMQCSGETIGYWIMEYLGNPHSSVLVSGIGGWIAAGYPTSTNPTTLPPTTFHATVNDSILATTQWLSDHLNDTNVVIIDVRNQGEYNGSVIQTLRGGHIPGAININAFFNFVGFAPGQFGVMKSQDDLTALYAAIPKDKDIVVYCQTGGRGSLTFWALQLIGYPHVRYYDDSWFVWGNDLRLPVEDESFFDFSGLQKNVKTLSGTASQLNATVNSLQAKVDQLNATVNSLQAKVDQLNGTANNMYGVYGAYLVGIIGVILAIWAGTRKHKA
jgi:thiosulfate/3-mercaptopyruvate sulfurtransferase